MNTIVIAYVLLVISIFAIVSIKRRKSLWNKKKSFLDNLSANKSLCMGILFSIAFIFIILGERG